MKKVLILVFALILTLSGTTLAETGEKPLAGQTLTIALSPDFMYFETISETEECGYEGLDIDIIKSLSEKLGFEFEITPMAFASLIGTLQTGNADLVISGMSYTEERAEVVDFSVVYAETDFGIVTPIDSDIESYDDLVGKVICCSQGGTYEGIIQGIEGAKLVTYQGQSAVGLAVSQGSDGVEAGMTSINGSKKLANTVVDDEGNPTLKYFVMDYDGISDIYNIAFPKGSELLDLFNTELEAMISSGEMETLIKKWLY